MGISVEFCGWDRPALQAAAEWLVDRYRDGSTADMRDVAVVVPGRRAGRRLLELLVEQAEEHSLLFTPPIMETVGRVPEQLYWRKRPFASDLVQRLTWTAVLREAAPETLAPIIPFPPAREEMDRWYELGGLLQGQHRELAADGLDFGQVAEKGERVEGFAEGPRWRAMHAVQTAYLARLDAQGLWDIQTARLYAIREKECHTERSIVLVGTVDMNVATRQMLKQVSARVTALVFAPADEANRFDELGCLVAEAWQDVSLPLRTEQIVVADGPAEQANAAARAIADFEGRFRADEIVVGVLDEELVPDIERTLRQFQLPSRWGPGRELLEAAPCQLLRCVAAFAQGRRFADLASLVRHPDAYDWLIRQGIDAAFLQDLDRYASDFLQYRLVDEWYLPSGSPRSLEVLRDATALLLEGVSRSEQPLAQWTEPLLEILRIVYGDRHLLGVSEADRMVMSACQSLRDTLLGHQEVPLSLQPRLRLSEVVQLTLDQLARETVPPPATEAAIELLGWLELPLDDAPSLVVTGLNEGFVPSSLNSDLFLPNALRKQLGLWDNARRYARDAYALAMLLQSRMELRFIVGRRSRDGVPLTPSRLLFAADPRTAAERAKMLFAPPSDELAQIVPEGLPEMLDWPNLPIPRPDTHAKRIDTLSVTSFRDYLACRYRFYLRHILRLRSRRDDGEELDGAAFGNLAHEVLRRFGTSAYRHSSDAQEIAHALNDELNRCANERFGQHAMPAVYVQVEQLRIRLRQFAQCQAEWVEQGWRIERTEVPTGKQGPAPFEVDGEPFFLSGRIDRIDFHRETGRYAVLDYKTSDTPRRPEQTHQRKKEWKDLQLPLYRHLARSLGIEAPCDLGYVNLPGDVSRIEFRMAEWTEADLASADEVARGVIRKVRMRDFWPPVEPPPDFSADFAPICQDDVFEKDPG